MPSADSRVNDRPRRDCVAIAAAEADLKLFDNQLQQGLYLSGIF